MVIAATIQRVGPIHINIQRGKHAYSTGNRLLDSTYNQSTNQQKWGGFESSDLSTDLVGLGLDSRQPDSDSRTSLGLGRTGLGRTRQYVQVKSGLKVILEC